MKILSTIRSLVRWTSLALLAALVVTPLLQITMRGIFNVPLAGAEELARYFLICLIFLGSSYVTVEGGQIRMEEFQALIPPKPRWVLQLTVEAAGAVFFGILFVACAITISRNMNNMTPIIEMPFWLFFAPFAIGALLLALETAVMFVHTWRRHRAEDKQTVLT